ncbi:MAG: DUF7194 family protein [Shewanella sp.]
MSVPLNPVVNTEGLFITKHPFELDSARVYKLEAIRTFPELARRNINVFEEYYKPAGLTQEDFIADSKVFAAILVFRSSDGDIKHVPNTYLESYPGTNSLDYNRNVVVLDLGPCPAYVDVSRLSTELAEYVKGIVGVTVTPEVTKLTYEGHVSDEEHIRMEAIRKDNIRKAIPLAEELAAMRIRVLELEKLNASLIEILQSKGMAN